LHIAHTLRFVAIGGNAGYLWFLVVTGRWAELLHPRFGWLIIAAAALVSLFTVAIVLTWLRGTPTERPGAAVFLFALPLLFAATAHDQDARATAIRSALAEAEPFGPAITLPEVGEIVVDGDTYYRTYNAVWDQIDELLGRTVTTVGFVYHSPLFPDDVFVVARHLLWCCAADASTIGFYSKIDSAKAPEADTWVRVTGRLGKATMPHPTEDRSFTAPAIQVEEIEPVDPLPSRYVVP
jgi:putative membrane protein